MWAVQQMAEYLESRLPDSLTADISGNAPIEIKELAVKWFAILRMNFKENGFAGPIASRVKVTDVSILPSTDDPLRVEGRMTCEIDVTLDMCNEQGVLSGGCIVTLFDEGSNISMVIASAIKGRQSVGVSQTINMFFHAPAVVGVTLRLVHFSIASDSQMNSGRSEIWDTTNHRLVASGTQLSMSPSTPQPKPEIKSSL